MCCYYFNFGSKGSARNSSSIKGTPLIRYFWVSKIKSFCCVFLLLYLQKGNNIAKQFIPCEHIKLNSIIHNNIAGLVITILRLRHLDTSHSQVSTLFLASLVTAISSSSATSSSSLGFLLSVIREKRDEVKNLVAALITSSLATSLVSSSPSSSDSQTWSLGNNTD